MFANLVLAQMGYANKFHKNISNGYENVSQFWYEMYLFWQNIKTRSRVSVCVTIFNERAKPYIVESCTSEKYNARCFKGYISVDCSMAKQALVVVNY